MWLSIQGKDEPKGKGKKKELKLAVSYMGWKKRLGIKKNMLFKIKLFVQVLIHLTIKKLVAAIVAKKYNAIFIKMEYY